MTDDEREDELDRGHGLYDRGRGLYDKYIVVRKDGGSQPGGKHEHCRYFVLDLNHDPHALPAIRAYAESCRKEYPELARDLGNILLDVCIRKEEERLNRRSR